MRIHIVRPGDTLWKLAKRYNVPLQQLIDANPEIQDPNKLEAGMKIRIPTGGVPVRPPLKPGHPSYGESPEEKYPHGPEKEWDDAYDEWPKVPELPELPYPPYSDKKYGGYPVPPYMPGVGYEMPGLPYMPVMPHGVLGIPHGMPIMPYPLYGMPYPMTGMGSYGYGGTGYMDPCHLHPSVPMPPYHTLGEESSSSSI